MPTHRADQHEKNDVLKVPGGGHVLIVPIAHVATLDSIPEELRAPVIAECNRYISKRAVNVV